VILDRMWGLPPALDMGYEKCMQATVREMVCAGLADSIHDISDGGLAVGAGRVLVLAPQPRVP
jgi:phosphoribosylformylglycinamidine synthase